MFFATQPFRTPRCSAEPTPPANIHTGPMDATASPTESVARENAEIAGHTPPPSLLGGVTILHYRRLRRRRGSLVRRRRSAQSPAPPNKFGGGDNATDRWTCERDSCPKSSIEDARSSAEAQKS
jgi:hypothetical protein